MRRFASRIDPFKLCPFSILFWFLIEPYNAIGISIRSLREVSVFWRQQIEPNQTVYLLFNLLNFRLPFPLTLLLLFSASGLVIMDGVNILLSAKTKTINELEIVEDPKYFMSTFLQSPGPSNLLPKMSIYFPVYDSYTSIGFLTIDFRHIEFSIKQALVPDENIYSIIRFIDLYTPFPNQIAVMILSVGLFLSGQINTLLQLMCED